MVKGALHLVTGKEDFLKKEFVRELKKRTFPAGSNPELNFQEFSGETHPVSSVLDFLRTAPFLGPKRMAVLWDLDDLDAEEETLLSDALETLPDTAVLVLAARDATPKKDPFLRALSGKASTVPCYAPFENEFPAWVQARARRMNLKLDRAAAELIAERTGRDVVSVISALDNLALFVSPRTQAEAADVEALLGRSLQADVFNLVDFLVDGDAPGALRSAQTLFREGTRAYEIVAVLAGQFEKLRRAAGLMENGRMPRDAAQDLGVPSFFADKFARQAQRLPKRRAVRSLEALVECDEAIKTGRDGENFALERLVLRLCA
ncbi:MAG TPA: DNA polymerase III subunit delta [Candidatus Eisenbacteria bacterium]|nr:DNA polymerase III subunit delta [Candidatus Eisenbacteria bacterium]